MRPIEEARRGFLHIPAIKVRQAAHADDEPPTFVRSRFGWDVQEVSGSLGDLGTFLPHIIGAITIVRMDPTGILTTFGLFYALSGAFYGVPMAVQPMKAASAAMLIEPMNPGAVAVGFEVESDCSRCGLPYTRFGSTPGVGNLHERTSAY